jgi:hypothetical protein
MAREYRKSQATAPNGLEQRQRAAGRAAQRGREQLGRERAQDDGGRLVGEHLDQFTRPQTRDPAPKPIAATPGGPTARRQPGGLALALPPGAGQRRRDVVSARLALSHLDL